MIGETQKEKKERKKKKQDRGENLSQELKSFSPPLSRLFNPLPSSHTYHSKIEYM